MTQLPADELAAMEETVALAGDPATQQEIAEAESAYAAGDSVTGDELRARLACRPTTSWASSISPRRTSTR